MNVDQMDRATSQVDAVVVGAGFAGLRTIHELRRLELSMRVFEAGSDVGGTWYWNRYPGARTDTESWGYCFFFDRELGMEWEWSERFPSQPEVHRYLAHVADRYDMRKEITFGSRVTGADFEESTGRWTVSTQGGEVVTCRWLITGLGWLGVPYQPDFPGLDSFTGECYQTSTWPEDEVQLGGKRVAVIGRLLDHALRTGAERVEARLEAGEAWTQLCDMILGMTLIPKGIEDRPWFLGANVPGKKPTTLCYLGGMQGYVAELQKELDASFTGFTMASAPIRS